MGEFTDLIFMLASKSARWFNVQGKRICFVIWSISVAYWVARNASMGLMVQTVGCLISLGLHIYGWWNWKNKGIGDR